MRLRPEVSSRSPLAATALLDPLALSAWVVVTGEYGALMTAFYLFTILGFGFRVGRQVRADLTQFGDQLIERRMIIDLDELFDTSFHSRPSPVAGLLNRIAANPDATPDAGLSPTKLRPCELSGNPR